RQAGPLRILWAARWEHDKNPEDFFEALKILKSRNVTFRLSIIGEQFREAPEIFAWAREHFADHIDRWGYQQSRAEYVKALGQADVFVSTAKHEFFGITAVEAILAGAYPVLPMRLAYPEILRLGEEEHAAEFFYEGRPVSLADKLTALANHLEQGCLWGADAKRIVQSMGRFRWDNLVATLDEAVERASSDEKLV
ncbi:MAG: glycosyltransferase, partial [Planctomycetota bacterium]